MQKMSSGSYKKIYYLLIIAIVVVSMIPLVAISRYDCPSADDYNYAITTVKAWNTTHSVAEVLKAAVQTSVEFWNTWQGLYVSAFLLSLQPAIFGGKWYALTGIIMLMLIVGSTVFFSSYLLKRLFKRDILEGMTIGFVMSFLMVQYMPSCVEGLYWFNGAVNYGFFYAVLLIYICLFIELQREHSGIKEALLFLACLLGAFLLEGGNHVTAFMGVVFAAVISLALWRRNKRKTIENISLFFIALGLLFFNICSPGTAIRAAAIEENGKTQLGVLLAVFRAMWEGLRNVEDWFGFKEIALLILLLPILLDIIAYIRKEMNFKFRYPLAVITASVAWLALMYCPPFYALGGCGPDRLRNVVYYCFIILLFIDAIYIIGWLQNIIPEEFVTKIQLSNWKYIQTAAILSFALFFSSATYTWAFQGIMELYRGKAKTYSEEFLQREAMMLDSAGEDVTVLSFSTQPELLFFDDLTEDADDWRNTGVSDYYGLKSIVLQQH